MAGTQDDPAAIVEAIVRRLVAAGMVIRHRSAAGASYYLGAPGRSGTLRVSDHAPAKAARGDRVASITIAPRSMPRGGALDRLVAEGVGRYMLNASRDDGLAPLAPAPGPPGTILDVAASSLDRALRR